VVGREAPLEVFGPPGIVEMTDHIIAAYSKDLEIRKKRKGIDDFTGYLVNPHEYEIGPVYVDKNVKVIAFPVNHGEWEHAYGFRFRTKNRSIVISGDTRPSDTVIEACNGCDVLVHEVYCYEGWSRGEKDWQSYHASYHTSGPELAELATKARPKLLVLYHKLFFGCTPEQLLNEVKSKYNGKVVLGEDLGVY
jgi:ribonuclease Z